MRILVIKIGALGDVLRTTSILPGLQRRYPGARITWLTARGAVDLLRLHPRLERVVGYDPSSARERERVARELGAEAWGRVVSLDDEREPAMLASRLAGLGGERGGAPAQLTGAFVDAAGALTYSEDSAPWFDMGLISRHGKAEADRRKLANRESHARLLARVLGIEEGRAELHLPEDALARARARLADCARPRIGLNTGAGGRWASKRLDVERTAALARELARRPGGAGLVLLGGPEEAQRNARILRAAAPATLLDTGVDNALTDFAALVAGLDLLVTSDSLALHVAIASGVPVVAFFAPTSAAEIELHGRGEKVVSTAPDAGSYLPDADTSTLTVERLAAAVERVLTETGRVA